MNSVSADDTPEQAADCSAEADAGGARGSPSWWASSKPGASSLASALVATVWTATISPVRLVTPPKVNSRTREEIVGLPQRLPHLAPVIRKSSPLTRFMGRPRSIFTRSSKPPRASVHRVSPAHQPLEKGYRCNPRGRLRPDQRCCTAGWRLHRRSRQCCGYLPENVRVDADKGSWSVAAQPRRRR